MFMQGTELLGGAKELDLLEWEFRGSKQDCCSLKLAANLLHSGSIFQLHWCSCNSMQETELIGAAEERA